MFSDAQRPICEQPRSLDADQQRKFLYRQARGPELLVNIRRFACASRVGANAIGWISISVYPRLHAHVHLASWRMTVAMCPVPCR
jgi:hypothetical protein